MVPASYKTVSAKCCRQPALFGGGTATDTDTQRFAESGSSGPHTDFITPFRCLLRPRGGRR